LTNEPAKNRIIEQQRPHVALAFVLHDYKALLCVASVTMRVSQCADLPFGYFGALIAPPSPDRRPIPHAPVLHKRMIAKDYSRTLRTQPPFRLFNYTELGWSLRIILNNVIESTKSHFKSLLHRRRAKLFACFAQAITSFQKLIGNHDSVEQATCHWMELRKSDQDNTFASRS
jgi:hypothetical protein